jgi:transposase InsO family protein
VSTKHTNDLVIEAYLDTVRNTGKSLIVHTDQGSEYKSKEYADLMVKLGVKISMSKKVLTGKMAIRNPGMTISKLI